VGPSPTTHSVVLLALVALTAGELPAQDLQALEPANGATVSASCDFEGPYSEGEQQIHDGCANNWQWGRKDMVLRADRDAHRGGTVQRIQVRGIASGGMQFFFTRLQLTQDRYYRISYWLRSDGLEGPVRCYVRKIDYPWTVYVWGGYEPARPGWARYSFTGKCAEDVPGDVGVCWEGGSLGTIWLDDLVVEESTQPFPQEPEEVAALATSALKLPRTSFEGRRDHFWSTMFFGWNRDGVWEGVEGDWEDPQMYRAEGGRVGRSCMAVPSATHAGQAGTLSLPMDLPPGRPYTVSLWMRSEPPGYRGSAALLYYWGGRHHQGVSGGAVSTDLTGEWQRYSFTCTPEPPPDAADPTAPIQVCVQIAPSATQAGTVFVDGLQIEAGESASDYAPSWPLELYADAGDRVGNLFEWDEVVPLNLLVAAADTTALTQAEVEVTVTAFPDEVVWQQMLTLPADQEQRIDLRLPRRGLMRVDLRATDPALAAPQELVLAVVPPPRNTGERGMFGTHIALRPALVEYVRRLGFTWTRLHDCSLLTKWSATEPEPGRLQWHDEVVDGVRAGGVSILGLPDHEPEWARVTTEGANPIDVAAFERYCEELARHYVGRVDHWEVWNEPYMGGSYSGGAERFGEVLQAGHAGLKRGNPDCTVLGWCADITSPGWGAGIAEEARRSLDIFSFHSYINGLSGGGTVPFAVELSEHQALWPAHVTECWNTEGTNSQVCGSGFYRHMPLATEETNERATAFASRIWIEHARAGVSKFFVYQMHNVDTMMYYGGYQSLLIQYDRTPTPAAVSAAVTAWCMDAMEFRPCPPAEGVVQALFAGDGRATWAIYDDGGVLGRRRLDLGALPAGAQVLDVMGNDPRTGDEREWAIGICPLFVVSTDMPADGLAAACRDAIVD